MSATGNRFVSAIFSVYLTFFLMPLAVAAPSPITLMTTECTIPPGIATAIIGSTISSEPKITNLTVYLGDRKVAETVVYPPQYNFIALITNDVPGDFEVTVKGVDQTGSIVSSDPVLLHYPTRPRARLLFPTNGATVFFGEDIKIQVEPIIDYGEVVAMSIYHLDEPYLYEFDQSPPYEFVWRARSPGTYTFNASPWLGNYGYGESAEPVTLTILPESVAYITEQPDRYHRVNPGQPFQLQVTSVSRGTQRHQWLLNGNPIPGATNTTFRIESPSSADDGYYSVVIDNFAGRTSSSLALVEVKAGGGGQILFANKAPGIDAPILASPAGVPVLVQMSAGPTPDRMDLLGPLILTTNGYFDGGALTLSNVPPGGKVFVQVRASKTFEFLHSGRSKILELTAGGSQPTPLIGLASFELHNWDYYYLDSSIRSRRTNLPAGDTVELEATAIGYYGQLELQNTNVWFQWRKNGQPIPGATNAILRIESAQRSDAAWYSFLATDGTNLGERGMALNVLDSLRLNQTETGNLRIRANRGARYTIESSNNLQTWFIWKFLTAPGDEFDVLVYPPPPGHVFFRAIAEP